MEQNQSLHLWQNRAPTSPTMHPNHGGGGVFGGRFSSVTHEEANDSDLSDVTQSNFKLHRWIHLEALQALYPSALLLK